MAAAGVSQDADEQRNVVVQGAERMGMTTLWATCIEIEMDDRGHEQRENPTEGIKDDIVNPGAVRSGFLTNVRNWERSLERVHDDARRVSQDVVPPEHPRRVEEVLCQGLRPGRARGPLDEWPCPLINVSLPCHKGT